jgi:hypothetical protein
MTDQQIAAQQTAAGGETTQAAPAAEQVAEPTAEPSVRPAGTRELRDAQQANTAPATQVSPRPPIKATETDKPAANQVDAPLFDEANGSQLRERWLVIQTEFVDEPRNAVEKADALVAEVLKQLTDTFAREREELEAAWSSAGDGTTREVSTEDLRMAIQRYRSFFNRLLAL